MAEQRAKEIGICKVLGASMQNIILLLSRDFLKLKVIAGIIPIGYYASNTLSTKFSLSHWSQFTDRRAVYNYGGNGEFPGDAAEMNPLETLRYQRLNY